MLTGMTTIQDGYIGSYQARLRGWDVATAYLTFLTCCCLTCCCLTGRGRLAASTLVTPSALSSILLYVPRQAGQIATENMHRSAVPASPTCPNSHSPAWPGTRLAADSLIDKISWIDQLDQFDLINQFPVPPWYLLLQQS